MGTAAITKVQFIRCSFFRLGESALENLGHVQMDFPLPVILTELFVHTEPLNISIFFRTDVLRKLFDIRFPYKHCDF